MNRSALPLVCGRYGRVRLCRISRPGERVAVGVAAIARAVVGQDPLDPDADLGEAGDRELDGPRGALAALVGDGHDDRVAAGIVDEHLEVVVAADRCRSRWRSPRPRTRQPPPSGTRPSFLWSWWTRAPGWQAT